MARLFGTDGIRGVANIFPMTPEMMVKIGMALGAIIAKNQANVIIGRDTRRSGLMLEYALSSGLTAAGSSVLLTGILPTPAVAFLTRKWQAHAGIVISASHNPSQDNGVKIFSSAGLDTTSEPFFIQISPTRLYPDGHIYFSNCSVHSFLVNKYSYNLPLFCDVVTLGFVVVFLTVFFLDVTLGE